MPLRQPGLFTTKDRSKFGTLSRVLGRWLAGPFVFGELGKTGKHLKGVGDKENISGFRKLGARIFFLLLSLELIPL